MTGSFLDVDAPNTAWRSGSEDPIPVIFGRYSQTAALYRYLTCRPLDGVARTDASFLRPGSKALTRSGRTAAHNYWPGWKRGLLLTRVPGLLALPSTLAALNEAYLDAGPWWTQGSGVAAMWLPHATYGTWAGVRLVRNRRHERDVLRPLRSAAYAILRTRDGVLVDVPRDLVRGRNPLAVGRVGLPAAHPVGDHDQEQLLDMVRAKLGCESLDARWNMEGASPWMELHIPPQPPEALSWEHMVAKASATAPYLGESAYGAVNWDLGAESPHLGVGGGSGSGKSELTAWAVAQLMRGGAGTVVLDPKYVSHAWLARIPEVLYCREPQMVHDTVVWLDNELRRRGAESAAAADAGESTPQFPRIVVVLEERNSLQTVIRDHWVATRPRGAPMRAPALAALDRLGSMGRSFGINVVLAAQEVTKADIGSRNNFGAFALAGRLPVGAWRLVMGPGARKPAMSTKPGRFGYVVGGHATVFQAAYPNLDKHSDRLIEFATQGNQLLDVKVMMQHHDTGPFPTWEPATSPDDATEEYVTLSQFAGLEGHEYTVAALRQHNQRDGRAFPDSQGTGEKNAKLFRLTDLLEWVANREENQS